MDIDIAIFLKISMDIDRDWYKWDRNSTTMYNIGLRLQQLTFTWTTLSFTTTAYTVLPLHNLLLTSLYTKY